MFNVITFVTHTRWVGLLWTRDRPVAETSNSQHTTITTDRHPWPGGIRTRNPKKRAAANLRLKTAQPRGSAYYRILITKS